MASFGLTATGRAVSKLREVGGNRMISVFYVDLQARWQPPVLDNRLGFAVGVNNLTKERTPGCVTCESNNFSQAVHDIPGRYLYARASIKM
jgi:outer membrane receptor protein involved in Fe transport